MANVSRPLLALLVGTVAFFALWLVALQPGSNSTGGAGSQGGLGRFDPAIAAAHHAVGVANQAGPAQGGEAPASAAPAASRSATPSPPAASAPVTRPAARTGAAGSTRTHPARPKIPTGLGTSATAASRVGMVTHALLSKRVVALLFYNPAGADDRAVRRELAAIPTHRHQVVKLAVPISELSRYPVITEQVPVQQSPTLVLIDRDRQASTIVGFTDTFEIAQRVLDALANR